MKVPVDSCESAIGAKQLTFMYGDVADRRHVRLIEIHLSGCCELREMFFLQWVILCVKVLNVDGQKCIL